MVGVSEGRGLYEGTYVRMYLHILSLGVRRGVSTETAITYQDVSPSKYLAPRTLGVRVKTSSDMSCMVLDGW